MWKQGNKSWISLRSLRHHDSFSCVLHAVSQDLTLEPHWKWVKDFINDSPKYEKMVKAMRTSKSFGPRYKFGIEVSRSTTFGQKQFKSNQNVLARPLPNAVFHHLIKPFLFRNPGEQRWPMLLSEVQNSQIKGEKALPSLQGGWMHPARVRTKFYWI